MNVEIAKSNFQRILSSLSQEEKYEFYGWLLSTMHLIEEKPYVTEKKESLGTEDMDATELKSIEPHESLISNSSKNELLLQEVKIDTDYGAVVVMVQGNRNKPAILTCHDIGLNSVSNFQAFFNFSDTTLVMRSFWVLHVNAPGQEAGAPDLPENYVYPNMDQLAETILPVIKYFGLKHFIGFGVGAGANTLSRFALQYPNSVDGLFLINPTCTVSSWLEWGHQKLNAKQLRISGMTESTQAYLMWHHFGRLSGYRSQDLTNMYRSYFNSWINPHNLSLFIDAYVKRTDLGIARKMDNNKKDIVRNFKCTTLLMTGDLSPHLNDSVIMNGRLDPATSTWMKLNGCAMVLEEEPVKVSEALRYFLQGLGYALNQCRGKSITSITGASITSSLNTSEVLYPMTILPSKFKQT